MKILSKLKMKNGENGILYNLIRSYEALIKKIKLLKKQELKYLLSWVSDCKKIIKYY